MSYGTARNGRTHAGTRFGRAFATVSAVPAAVGVGFLALALAGAWLLTIAAGGARHLAPHQFYIPIVLAGLRFQVAGAVATGALAMILAGPLTPAVTTTGMPQALSDWLSRGAFFVIIGAFLAAMLRQAQQAQAQELELLRRERELDEQRDRMIQAVSHEFRTPLTIIVGLAELLPKRPELSEERFAELLLALGRAAERLAELVEVVLAAAEEVTLGEEADAVIDIPELLQRIAQRLDEAYAASHRVVCRPGDSAARIVSDPARLQLALTQIIKNGLKYSDGAEPVVVSTARSGDGITITVRDFGPGVPIDIRQVVRPFRQGTEASGGLGVGLYAAVHVAEQLGGVLHVGDAADGGTEVTLSLPQRRAYDAALHPRDSPERRQTSPLASAL